MMRIAIGWNLFLIGVRTWLSWLSLFVVGAAQPLLATDVPAPVQQAERDRIEVIQRISQSTIAVFGVGDAAGGGSAVVISADGYALTNFHVTKPVGDHLKCGMNDGVLYDAVIVGLDPTGDVALIKLLGREDFPAAELGDSDAVRAGDWCIVSGNPFLLATDFHPTITYGIVSGVHRYQYPSGTLLEYADCIQTDASINPGNSGGPLWNARGQLIGINGRGSFEKRGRVNVGVGYAISINQIKNFMGYLRSGRIVDHATLGATVATDEDGRIIVTNILESSDAYRRGLRYGDEIIAFGGRSITSTNGFKNTLGIFPKGWRVPLTYRRDGERFDVNIRLAGLHAKEELIAKLELGGIAPPAPDDPPKPEDDPRAPEDRPQLPLPRPKPSEAHPKKKTDEPAKEIANVFAARRGFANYHFNLAERDRIWSACPVTSSLGKLKDTWLLEADLGNNRAARLELGERLAQGRIAKQWHEVTFERDLSDQLAPRRSGGLLLALHQWRRLLAKGPDTFGDVYYLGTAPWPGQDGLMDVLVGTYDVIETRFYFNPESGHLIGLEMFPDLDVDPCELHFADYQPLGAGVMPGQIEVHFAGQPFATLQIASISELGERNAGEADVDLESVQVQ